MTKNERVVYRALQEAWDTVETEYFATNDPMLTSIHEGQLDAIQTVAQLLLSTEQYDAWMNGVDAEDV